jgi:acetate kinase
MRVIVVNSGSSSIKYEVFALDDSISLGWRMAFPRQKERLP